MGNARKKLTNEQTSEPENELLNKHIQLMNEQINK